MPGLWCTTFGTIAFSRGFFGGIQDVSGDLSHFYALIFFGLDLFYKISICISNKTIFNSLDRGHHRCQLYHKNEPLF